LRGEEGKLLLDSSDNGTGTPVSSKEGWCILALERVGGITRESMCKEATMDVEKGWRKKGFTDELEPNIKTG
jgi:hypothetical protein